MPQYTLHFDQYYFSEILKNRISENEIFAASCISYRYIETEHLPRIGDLIMFPLFDIGEYLSEGIKQWLHQNLYFEVLKVWHNPTAVISFNKEEQQRNDSEYNIYIEVIPQLKIS